MHVSTRGLRFRDAIFLPNLVGRTADHSVLLCGGQRSFMGQLGSPRGQIAEKHFRAYDATGALVQLK